MRKLSLASRIFAAVAVVAVGAGVATLVRSPPRRRVVPTASLMLPLPEDASPDAETALCDGPVRRSPTLPPAAPSADEEAAGPPPGPLRVLESHGGCGAHEGLQSGRQSVATAVLRSICNAPEVPAISFSHVIHAASSGHWEAQGIVRGDGTFFFRRGHSAAGAGEENCHVIGRYDAAQVRRAAAWLRARGWASVSTRFTGGADVRSGDGYAYLDVMSTFFGRHAVRLSIVDSFADRRGRLRRRRFEGRRPG